jgi:hypothetical protein
MKQLLINKKQIIDEDKKSIEAERIEFGNDEIVGLNGYTEVFRLRGLNNKNTYEVSENGKIVPADKSEIEQLKSKIAELEKVK